MKKLIYLPFIAVVGMASVHAFKVLQNYREIKKTPLDTATFVLRNDTSAPKVYVRIWNAYGFSLDVDGNPKCAVVEEEVDGKRTITFTRHAMMYCQDCASSTKTMACPNHKEQQVFEASAAPLPYLDIDYKAPKDEFIIGRARLENGKTYAIYEKDGKFTLNVE